MGGVHQLVQATRMKEFAIVKHIELVGVAMKVEPRVRRQHNDELIVFQFDQCLPDQLGGLHVGAFGGLV